MSIRAHLDGAWLYGVHLCGSRVIGNAHTYSDWDYVAQDSPEMREYLRKLGLKRAKLRWADCITEAVYRGSCPETGERIDVALVTDVSYKLKVLDVVKRSRILQVLDAQLKGKLARLQFWSALYELAGAPPRTRIVRKR